MLSKPGRSCVGGRCSEAPDERPGRQKGPNSFEEPSKNHRSTFVTTRSQHRRNTAPTTQQYLAGFGCSGHSKARGGCGGLGEAAHLARGRRPGSALGPVKEG